MIFASSSFSQTAISGVVTDSLNNEPLPFANVYIKGTTQGSTTNLNGEYRLGVNEGTYTIVVSFMGYQSSEKEVTIGAGETVTLDFPLTAQSILGEEVIVTAMMRGQKSAISSQLNAQGL